MAGTTLKEAEERLAAYRAAAQKALLGQSYEIAGRRMERPDIEKINQGIKYWELQVKQLSAASSGKGRTRTVSPGW